MKKQLVFIFCLLSMIPMAQGQQWEEITFKRPPFLAERLFPGISSIACDSEYLYVFHEGTAVALLDRKDYLVRYIKTVKSDPQANGGMSILPMKSSTIVNTPVGIYVRFPGVDTLMPITLPTANSFPGNGATLLDPRCVGSGDMAIYPYQDKFYRSDDGGRTWYFWLNPLDGQVGALAFHDKTIWQRNRPTPSLCRSLEDCANRYKPFAVIRDIDNPIAYRIPFRWPWVDSGEDPEYSGFPPRMEYWAYISSMMQYDDERELFISKYQILWAGQYTLQQGKKTGSFSPMMHLIQ